MTQVIPTPRTATRIGVLLAAVLLCLMTVFGVSGAQAHDELISSTPASGDVLKTSPKSLVLTFSGDIKEIGTILELKAADGKKIGTTFKIDRRDVIVTPEAPLPNGSYTLVARVVSSDGHPIAKDIDFQVNGPAAVADSAPATAQAPDAGAPAAGPAPAAETAATADDTAEDQPLAGMPAGLVWTILALAGIGMVVLVLLKVRRQNK
ncbi:copper resistance protein CopC [Paeniglutamicibacter sp. ABSL32-1]|uniref:copper resistance CopC family protein n=1 Tax=Paeniglutamicibacter quisquiliarum TaxID=2849498 RepID=UPI001C2CDEBD|nr:copper resistance protein CopC [Paeniglutamicibacter quisquiliarum]MBV1780586.1 copper resistance protein CopC [Paeniglutamicibacter quisquiliarum]